jgi:mono/diheme cytochrome c family protein
MKSLIASVSLFFGLLPAGLGVSAAQTSQPTATVKKVPVHATQSLKGKDLFHEYCAVCHGASGKGDGPAASALKPAPSDLTQISAKNGGKFPDLQVQHIINGEADGPAAHGSKEMPMWGNLFRHMGPNQDLGAIRVYNLMNTSKRSRENKVSSQKSEDRSQIKGTRSQLNTAARAPILSSDSCLLASSPHHTLQGSADTIGSPTLQEKASWNSGIFCSTPLARNSPGEWGFVTASMRAASSVVLSHQICA